MFRESCAVLENKQVAPGHYRLRLRSRKISKKAKPGQFIQILCSKESFDPLLPRPFSFLKAERGEISILYHAVGKGTRILSGLKKGEILSVLGPLGNGFTIREWAADDRGQTTEKQPRESYVLVGGGVGIPPLYHLASAMLRSKIKKEQIHIFLGARNKALLLCEKEFRKLGVQVYLSTDDGSKGQKGFVTQALEQFLSALQASHVSTAVQLFTCGPTPMMKAVAQICSKKQIACQVSVEVPMACGFGACLGCALRVRQRTTDNGRQKMQDDVQSSVLQPSSSESSFRYAIACTEGPVFDGEDMLWE